MTPKEKLYWMGFECAANRVLGPCGVGAVLRQLVRSAPDPVSSRSFEPGSRYRIEADHLDRRGVYVAVRKLREALDDVGISEVIDRLDPEEGKHWGGYRISAENASKIIEFVEQNV